MCVIVVQLGKFPGWDKLKNCWDKNPQGAGYMYQKDNSVIISKGYTKFDDFKRSVESVNNYKYINIVYHFRIATHGTISPENTHPFPLTDNHKYMHSLDISCPCGIAHNGIINHTSYDIIEQKKYNLTDSSAFIMNTYRMCKNNYKLSKKEVIGALKLENQISNSRFAVMDANNVQMIGRFFLIDGCYYSNNYSHTPMFNSYKFIGGR